MEDHSGANLSEREANQLSLTAPPGVETGSDSGVHPPLADQIEEGADKSPEVRPASVAATGSSGLFTDDEFLPVFEAALDLPRSPVAPKSPAKRASGTEEDDD